MRVPRCSAFLLSLLVAAPAFAQSAPVSIQFQNGLVSVQARNASPRAILQEWARVGKTQVVNAERLTGGPLTLELTNVPEQQALSILLKSAGGYLVGARQALSTGPSTFDRIMIMPASSVPASTARPVAASASPAPPPPVAFLPGDPDDDPADVQVPIPPGGRALTAAELQNQLNQRLAAARAAEQNMQNQPNMPQQDPQVQQGRPGQTNTPTNPFFSGSSGRPGEIAPVPQRNNQPRPNGDVEP